MDPNPIALARELADRSPAERETYYAENHVEPALRAAVESLLRNQTQAVPVLATGSQLEQRRLGVFEIDGLLGRGGMGEVYRARDTRLGRDVAIKILPRAFRDDPEHVARFEREARVLASLNHPHIGVVHGFEETEGLKALVMELVQGEDLAQRLARGPLPICEGLDVARQIADALEAAHAQGIVHRDLKPSNVKRRPDGTVKVLDFGLAKVFATSADAATAMETQTIAGTPAYMSPEQARGDVVDNQSDIWSFGVVLFELLSGASVFRRKTTADTLASVLSAAPDYASLPPGTPSSVSRLIRHCLERDRRRRLKHIGDARLELEEALSASPDVSASLTPQVSRGVRSAWNARSLTSVAAALVAGLLIGAVWLAPRSAPSPVVRTIIAADAQTSSTERTFAFTPDGSRLGYITRDARQLLVRPLDSLDPVAVLTTAAYIRGVFPSPDGLWFGYVENNFTLRKIPTAGGAPVTVAAMDGPSRGATWGPGDTIVFGTAAPDTGLQLVAAGGGPVTVLTRPNAERGEADHVQPAWLPGSRGLLFTIVPTQGGLDAAKVAVLDRATGTWRTVLDGGYGARYVNTGHLVYAAAGALWAARFDLSRLAVQGTPVELVRPVIIDATGAAAEFDIAENGSLAYPRDLVTTTRRVPVWVDRSGRETALDASPEAYRYPRISPDGSRLALETQGDIYIWELARPWSTAARMTFTPTTDWFPVWTPDARRIVFGSWRGGRFSNLYVQDLRAGTTERLTDSPDMQLPTSITPDGKTVVFHSFAADLRSLQALRLDAQEQPIALAKSSVEERNGEVSPDGHWLAFERESTSRPGQLDIYVRPLPDANRGLSQVTRDGGTFPAWSRSGHELFYVAPDGGMMAVPVEAAGSTWKMGSPRKLFGREYLTREGSLGRLYDVAPDGRFLMLKAEAPAGSPHFVIVQNWVAELARRVR